MADPDNTLEAALERIMALYHNRDFPDPMLPFRMKEVALAALASRGSAESRERFCVCCTPPRLWPHGGAEPTERACWCSEDGIEPKYGHADDHVLSAEPTEDTLAEAADPLPTVFEELRLVTEAGNHLALAAHRVSATYDGVHRLRIALAKWYEVLANEFGRASRGGSTDGQSDK